MARRLKQSQVTSVSTRIKIKFMRIHGDPRGSMRSRGSVFSPCHHFKMVMGDFNAKIGKKQQNKTTIGTHRLGTRNKRDSRLVEFTVKEHLSVINTFFKTKLNQKLVSTNPKGTTSVINYILSNNRSIFTDCSVVNRFKVGSDHVLLRTTLKINVRKERRKLISNTTSIDYQKLQIRKNEFHLELSSRFHLLNCQTLRYISLKQC